MDFPTKCDLEFKIFSDIFIILFTIIYGEKDKKFGFKLEK